MELNANFKNQYIKHCLLLLLEPLQYPGKIKNKGYAKFLEANKVYYGRCPNGESDIKWHLILSAFISSLGNFRSD